MKDEKSEQIPDSDDAPTPLPPKDREDAAVDTDDADDVTDVEEAELPEDRDPLPVVYEDGSDAELGEEVLRSADSDVGFDAAPPVTEDDATARYAVGVRPRPAGPMEYFWARHHDLKPRMKVVVEAERGLAIGHVCTQRFPHEPKPGALPLRNVVRIADERDKLIEAENIKRNREALNMCREQITRLGLPMKLINVEYQHSANKATFFFASEGRVDFRELVRMLAQQLRIRVEMRQIGIRDEAKLLGGLGPCGLPVCCASFLDDFAPVSIRQAKEQNLTLNPEKVSGLCGRLMCCLGYESSTYRGEQEGLPKIGKKADTWKGRGRVLEINIFSRLMRMELESREYITISIDDYRAFKADPEGFAKVIAEREEEERKRAVEKLNSGGGGTGGRMRRRDTRPKAAPNGAPRSFAETKPEREPLPSLVEIREENPNEPRSRQDGSEGENGRAPGSQNSRRRRRPSGERQDGGGSPNARPSDPRPLRPQPPTSGRPASDGAAPSGEGADPSARSRSRRRGGRGRGGRRPGEGGGPNSGGSSGPPAGGSSGPNA